MFNKIFKIKNLKPCCIGNKSLDYSYGDNVSITIFRNKFSIHEGNDEDEEHVIENYNRIISDDIGGIIKSDKFIYRLRNSSNNGDEIVVALNFWQHILFKLINFDIKKFLITCVSIIGVDSLINIINFIKEIF